MTLFKRRNKQFLLDKQEQERYEAFIEENNKKKYDCSMCKNNHSSLYYTDYCSKFPSKIDTEKIFYLNTGKVTVPIKWNECEAFRMVNKCIACHYLKKTTMIIHDEKRTVYRCGNGHSSNLDKILDRIDCDPACDDIVHVYKDELIERYEEYNKGESNE